jgi:hypothetical protein
VKGCLLGLWCDVANNFNYILVFLLGFLLTAADSPGLRAALRSARWPRLALGSLLAGLLAAAWPLEAMELSGLGARVALRVGRGLVRGLAEWLLLLGLYGAAREACTAQHRILPSLATAAMPFYLMHQQVEPWPSGIGIIVVLILFGNISAVPFCLSHAQTQKLLQR